MRSMSALLGRHFITVVVVAVISATCVDARNASTFFIVPLEPAGNSTDVQTTCGISCKVAANDAYVAWILSPVENDIVSSLISVIPRATYGYYILGGNRRAVPPVKGALNESSVCNGSSVVSGTIWHWTVLPTQFIAHNTQGLPFFNGTLRNASLPMGYANFSTDEPSNSNHIETQLSISASTGTWNDLPISCTNFTSCHIFGCVCRHWSTRTASGSQSQMTSLTPSKPASKTLDSGFLIVENIVTDLRSFRIDFSSPLS